MVAVGDSVGSRSDRKRGRTVKRLSLTNRRARLVVAAAALLALAAGPAHAASPGRNGQIAWSYSVDPDQSESGSYGVLIANPATGERHNRAVHTCDYDAMTYCTEWSSVAYSPDGRRALAVVVPNANAATQGDGQIVLTNSALGGGVALPGRGGSVSQANFSPNGQRIIYVQTLNGHSQILTSDLAGGSVRAVPVPMSHAGSPQYFPGGREIIFTHNTTIWSAQADTGHSQALIGDGTAPDISPNGRSIVYIGTKSGTIYIARADGSHHRKVKLLGRLCRPPSCGGAAQAVVFSPDGSRLAFVWNSDPSGAGDPTLYTVSASGGRIKEIGYVYTDNAGGSTSGLSWRRVG